jgi:hypothetical protein
MLRTVKSCLTLTRLADPVYRLALLLFLTTPAHAIDFDGFVEDVEQAFETGDPFEDAADAVEEFVTGEDDPVPLPTAPVDVTECNGVPATIFGTDGRDRIQGTAAPDVIVALGGSDRVDAQQGNDIVCGGRGADTILGGPGDDQLAGERGADNLLGGVGANVVSGQFFISCTEENPCGDQLRIKRDYCADQPVLPVESKLCQSPENFWFAPDRQVPPIWVVQRANRFGHCGPWPGGC